jgi:hypothetical protein
VAFAWSQLGLAEALSGRRVPLRWAWMPLALPLIAPGILVVMALRPRVVWRGRGYTLGAAARLAEAQPPPSAPRAPTGPALR